MEESNLNKLTASQLRSWLQQLNMPTGGTKSALILRLCDIPQQQRGACPVDGGAMDNNAGLGDSGGEDEEGCGQSDLKSVEKENELLKRELELLKKENELYRKMKDFENLMRNGIGDVKKNNDNEVDNNIGGDQNYNNGEEFEDVKDRNGVGQNYGDSNDRGGGDTNENNIGETKDSSANDSKDKSGNRAEKVTRNEKPDVEVKEVQGSCANTSFGLLKELLPEYDGTFAPSIFVAQIKNIKTLYSVDDGIMKALLMSKVRGKIQTWLHTKSNFVNEDLDQLLDEMITLFGEKESRLHIRRKFEIRKWQYNEDFLTYFNNKVLLASGLDIPEDELIDYIIDGIPDNNLKIHANLQCFRTKEQLSMAFSKISLKKQLINRGEKRETGVRCYNCNCFGHYASDCQKPRREVGACYGCGSMEHLVAVCPQRKTGEPKNV